MMSLCSLITKTSQLLGCSSSSSSSFLSRCISGADSSVFGDVNKTVLKKAVHRRPKKKHSFGPGAFADKKIQAWKDWDGFGTYKYVRHDLPRNITNRDFQKRRILKKFGEDRLRVNVLRHGDMLPKELTRQADEELFKLPRDSSIIRVNRRCVVTGRGKGIFHQFRVSRFIFRAEADYNKVSGAIRAKWMHGIDINP